MEKTEHEFPAGRLNVRVTLDPEMIEELGRTGRAEFERDGIVYTIGITNTVDNKKLRNVKASGYD